MVVPSRICGFEFHERSQFFIGTHDETLFVAATRVYDEAGNVIETHEHNDEFKEP
jgi:hypothetical protein